MYPILFSLGNLHVYTHGLMIALGSIIGGFIIYFLARTNQQKVDFLFDLIVFSILGGLIGARVFYFIMYSSQFSNWYEIFYIWSGGLISFGGIVGGFLTAYLILKKKKQPVLKWLDFSIVGFLAGWGIGRIGCLLNNDAPGLITVSKLAIWGRFPTALFESIWSFVAALVCYWLLRQQKKKLSQGVIFCVGLMLYFVGRFFIDIYRDENAVFKFLKSGQITSLIFFLILFSLYIYLLKRSKIGRRS